MVQLFHYESVGAKCQKLIGRQASSGQPIRVILHADDACGAPSSSAHLLLDFPLPWLGGAAICRVAEFGSGGRALRTCWARVAQPKSGDATLTISGRFGGKKKRKQPGQQQQPPSAVDFVLSLTSRVSEADFQLGYSMTGWLQMGNSKQCQWRVTHAAMVRRQGY